MEAENFVKMNQDLTKILALLLNLSKCSTCEETVVESSSSSSLGGF